jgi:multimeric flavodoxin WrbA
LDKDLKTELSEDLKVKIIKTLEEFGHIVDVFELGNNDVTPCYGCLLCVTKHPGECFNKDIVNEIRKNIDNYSATFYLTPVLFGHYSSTIASPMNKGAGSNNLQVVIGYGDDIDEEERRTFIDLTAKHRGKADIVHPGLVNQVDVFVSESIKDNAKICEALKKIHEINL